MNKEKKEKKKRGTLIMYSEAIMKACMLSNTYDKCPIEKCRECEAKKECSKKARIALGGS
jgi:hypothetical protein